MKYILVNWKHDLPAEPIYIYSEIDSNGWERRKVEVFRSGTMGYANESQSVGGTRLSKEPLPTLDQIASDSQFEPIEKQRVRAHMETGDCIV